MRHGVIQAQLDVCAAPVALRSDSTHQTRLLEDSQVVREQIGRNGEGGREFTGRGVADVEVIDDREANRIPDLAGIVGRQGTQPRAEM